MSVINTTHRCSDGECPYVGCPSAHSCACHLSAGQIAQGTANELLDVLLQAREKMLGASPSMKALIARTDAAIAKATGR